MRRLCSLLIAVLFSVSMSACSPGESPPVNTLSEITTIEEAKRESLRIMRELVGMADGLAISPAEDQPESIETQKLVLAPCRDGGYQYPGITAVVFADDASVLEFEERILSHFRSSSAWEERRRTRPSGEVVITFNGTNGFTVGTVTHTDANNKRVVIRAYSPCVELPEDFPNHGGYTY